MAERYGDLIEELNYDCARACKTAEPCEECASCRAAQEFARLLRSQEQLLALVQAVRDDRAKGRQTFERDIDTGFRLATAAYVYVDALIEAEKPAPTKP